MNSSALKSQGARAARRRAKAPACNSSPSPLAPSAQQPLAGARQALLRAQGEFEARVQERTRELEETNEGLRAQIAESEQAKQVLARSEERYRSFFEHNLDGVVSVDLEGRFKEANPAAQRMSGYSADELRELSFIDICAPDQLHTTLKHFQGAIEGRLRDLETAIIRKGGRRVELFVTGSPVFIAGRVVGLFLIVRDITERKRAEAFRQAINSINEVIHSTIESGQILQRTLSAAAQVLGSETGAISLRKNRGWIVSHVHNLPETLVGAEMNEQEEPHALLAVQTKKPIAIADAFKDERVNREHTRKRGIRSVMVVPLVTKNEAVGVLIFNYYKCACTFDHLHLDFAAKLAAATTLALENSNLFEKLQGELTERKQVEMALRGSEARLAGIVGSAMDAIISVDARQRIVLFNAAAERMFRCPAAQVMGQPVDQFLPESVRAAHQEHVRSFGQTGEAARGMGWPRKVRGRRTDGQEFPIEASISQIETGGEKLFTVILRDITEREQAEEALRKSEHHFRQMANSMPQLAWTANVDGTVDFWNAHFEAFTGLNRAADHPSPYPVCPDDLERTVAAWEEAVRTGTIYEIEHRLRRFDGQYRWHLSRAIPARGEQGRIVKWYATATDIHDLIRTEQALQTSQRQLRQFAQELERRVQDRTAQLRALAVELTQAEERERRRLAQILHDHLQQMLFGARLHVDLLRGQNQEPAFLKHVSQVGDLLTNCIELSRSLAQELSPPVLHDMGLAAGLKWLGRWMKQNHGLAVELALDDKAGPDDQQIRLLLFQSIRELLFNTVKHSGVRTAHVQMKRFSDDQVQLVVSDQGAGFDPAQLKSASTGFGLHSIRERLELFGARLDIDSAAGRGSRFTLTAPLRHIADKSSKWA